MGSTDEIGSAKNELAAPSGIGKTNHPKLLLWASISLFSISGLFWVFWFVFFAAVHWSRLSPGAQGEEVVTITISLIKVFIPVAIVAWVVKGKTEKLLASSVVLVVVTAIFAFYFFDARHKAQEKAAEANRTFVCNINILEEFLKQGGVGDVPEFKLTGDAENDAFWQLMRGFYRDYLHAYHAAEKEIEALQETSAFDDMLLTNRLGLEVEIEKRIAAQQMIAKFSTNALSMVEATRKKCESLNVSEDFKQGTFKSFDEMIPQYEAMFAAAINYQKSDEDLLRFLHDNFQDYELGNGNILFGNTTNRQTYDELAKKVQDTYANALAFQKRAMAGLEATKQRFQ